jgi:hypothetical protein
LVRKLSAQQEASSSQIVQGLTFDSEVGNLHLLLTAKDQELLESKQKHSEFEIANAQLRELLEAANQKN